MTRKNIIINILDIATGGTNYVNVSIKDIVADGWSDEEKENMLALANGISKIVEDKYKLSVSLTEVYTISV